MSLTHRRRMLHITQPYSKPQIISFADVVLVLLVIFLVSTTAAMQMAIVNLPWAGNTAGRDARLAVNVTVGKDGMYYYEDLAQPIKPKDLWTFLRDTKLDRDWFVALIRADKKAPADQVALPTYCLQGLGVKEIAFPTEEKEKASEPSPGE